MEPQSPVAAIGRDPDALERFYRQHLEPIQGFIARRVESRYDAAERNADVFVRAIGSCSGYDPRAGSPSAWLYGIARNVVADHCRSADRGRRATQRFNARDLLDDDSIERLTQRIDAERESRELFASMAVLPANQRAVVELVAIDGLSLVEAAQALGISATNARVRYHRARRRLTFATPPASEVTS